MLSLTANNMFHVEASSKFKKQEGFGVLKSHYVPNLDRKSLSREVPQCPEGEAIPQYAFQCFD